MANAFTTAFGTGSSSATLPVTISLLEEKNQVIMRVVRVMILMVVMVMILRVVIGDGIPDICLSFFTQPQFEAKIFDT